MKRTATTPNCDGLELLLNYLKQSQGCDLTAYKRSTLSRRISVRMQQLGINGYDNYLEYLKEHPEELCPLLNTLFINVTGFFRDRAAWDYLADEVLPKMIANKTSEPIRLWSASCASGEEAYTLAMLMAEALGMEQYRQQAVIYATDVDEAALQQARRGFYPHSDVAGVPGELLHKYFESTEQGYIINPSLRRRVVFARHNLLEDAPISKLDLLVCRNTLMYFNSEAQVKILTRLHFALNNSGFLFMGQAETLTSCSYLFTLMSIKHRIFTKNSKLRLDDILLLRNRTRSTDTAVSLANSVNFWKTAFETNPVAQIVVTDNGRVAAANARARDILGLTSQYLGYHWRGLPGIVKLVSLGSKYEQVLHSCCSTDLKDVKWSTARGITHLDIELSPIFDASQSLLGVNFTFTEVNQFN